MPDDRGSPQRPTVVFDLGGVLIDWNPRTLYRKLFNGDEHGMERFLAEVCTPDWNRRLDAGLPFADGVAELIARFPDQAERIRAYDERWEEMVSGALPGTPEILDELHGAGVHLWALSNWATSTFARVRERFPFLERFAGTVLSGEVGTTKPDERIYRVLLDRAGRRAADCLFIDDVGENLHAARRLGFATVLFTSAPALRADLEALGLLGRRRVP